MASEKVRDKFEWDEIVQKTHRAMKLNGTYGKSRSEDEFHLCLCSLFGKENVARQQRVGSWDIDFYVKSIDAFVQFDGAYWHGLNRSDEELLASASSRDKVILGTKIRDRLQDEYFSKRSMRLLRVTDVQFKKFKKSLDRFAKER